MPNPPLWANPTFWKKMAVWVTALSFLLLIVLTFDSLRQTLPGGTRVPAYTVINQSIDYRLDTARNRYQPVIGGKELLFGQEYDAKAAEALVALGKKTTQGKNCMNCHTFLGNGAYYAPDLTKAWLDPGWIDVSNREAQMIAFLKDPPQHARTFGTGRKMPNPHLTDEEIRGVIAFLKWMSAIDTNGFPHRFQTLTGEHE